MRPRSLEFHNFDEALAEVDRLHRGGYEKAGRWDLALRCDFLCLPGQVDAGSAASQVSPRRDHRE